MIFDEKSMQKLLEFLHCSFIFLVRFRKVPIANYCIKTNEFSMFSYWSCCMLFSLTSKKLNASLATWCAPRRSRSRNIAVRNVFRALIREQHLLFLVMFKIYYVIPHILRPCPPEHTVRNVWRASSLPSVPPLGRPSGHLGRQARPGIPGNPAPPGFWPPKAATECLAPPSRTSPRASSDLPRGILHSRLRHAYEVA
mgnify:CR=1 FL=1